MEITWNKENVAAFLRTEPIIRAQPLSPDATETEYLFTFRVGATFGRLSVYPSVGGVRLSVSPSANDEPFATWTFDCIALEIHDAEVPEEGGLVIIAVPPTGMLEEHCAIRISPAGDTFEVETWFHRSKIQ